MKNKILSIILSVVMIVSMIPLGMVTVSAATFQVSGKAPFYNGSFKVDGDTKVYLFDPAGYSQDALLKDFAGNGMNTSKACASGLVTNNARSYVISTVPYYNNMGEGDTYSFYVVVGPYNGDLFVSDTKSGTVATLSGATNIIVSDSAANKGEVSKTADKPFTGQGWYAKPSHTHKDATGADVTFKAVNDLTALKDLFANGGSGYLANDITADGDLTVTAANVNLCLNDKVLNLKNCHITVNSEKTFNLYDEGDTKRYYDKADSGLWTLKSEGTSAYTTTGGVITGGWATHGGAVYNLGTFTMYNGNIVGNRVGGHGGGVDVESGTFTMYNGNIVGNKANTGGGLKIGKTGIAKLSNAVIEGNCSTGNGGGILNNNALTVDNCTINNNVAKIYGGGIHNNGVVGSEVENGTVTISNTQITGNTANYGGGIHNGYKTILGEKVTITGNTATTLGGGISGYGQYGYEKKGQITFNGGEIVIKDNTCTNNSALANLALETGYTINIEKTLTDSDVHATVFSGTTATIGVLTSGYATYGADVFTYEGPNKLITNADGELEVVLPHTHAKGTEYMTDGRAHWLKCADEGCTLKTVEDYKDAFADDATLKETLGYKETVDVGGLMGRQGLVTDNVVSQTKGRTIIGLTEDQLKTVENNLIIVGSDGNKQVEVSVDCVYTYFYNGETKVEATGLTDGNDGNIVAFAIIDNNGSGEDITGYGYYRVYNDSLDNFMFDVLYAAPEKK